MTLYILSACSFFPYPIYKYVYFNEIVPLTTIYIPFLDENTSNGFIVVTIYHLLCMIYSVIGSASLDFTLIMIAVNVPVMGNILNDDIQALNELVASDEPDPTIIKTRLKNIFLQHQEIVE